MSSLKLKTVCDDSGNLPRISLQDPHAELGVNALSDTAMVTTDEIIDIPAGIPVSQVVRLWRDTCYIGWLGKHPTDPSIRHQFRLAELGAGKIIRS